MNCSFGNDRSTVLLATLATSFPSFPMTSDTEREEQLGKRLHGKTGGWSDSLDGLEGYWTIQETVLLKSGPSGRFR